MILEIKNSDPDSMWSFLGNSGQWGMTLSNYKEEFLNKQNWLEMQLFFIMVVLMSRHFVYDAGGGNI